MLISRSLGVRTAIIAATVLLVAYAIANLAGHSAQAGAAVSPDPTPVAAVSADIADNFAIFRDQRAVNMPPDVVTALASPARFARNASLAREIQTLHGPGWIVPGDGWLCIIAPDPIDSYGTGCSPIDSALVHGLVLGLRDGPTGAGYVTALVPDGAQAALTVPGSSIPGRQLSLNDGVISTTVAAEQDVQVTPAP
jgi:hypothetical protein